MELRWDSNAVEFIEFNELSRIIVILRGISEVLAEVDNQRSYHATEKSNGESGGLVYECLNYATGAGFKEVFSEWGIEFQTAQEFRQRHITAALRGIYG